MAGRGGQGGNLPISKAPGQHPRPGQVEAVGHHQDVRLLHLDPLPGQKLPAEHQIFHGIAGLVLQPDLLLMDEPYGQMDIKLRFYLEDEVTRLWKETGTTVVFITHNIEEAVYLAERILILTNKPAHIKEEVQVNLPRPRDVTAPDFIAIRNHVTEQIKWW